MPRSLQTDALIIVAQKELLVNCGFPLDNPFTL
jgi:hypothetical protein